jgi:hypothetical protein
MHFELPPFIKVLMLNGVLVDRLKDKDSYSSLRRQNIG